MSPSELDPGRPILTGWREHSESSQSALRYRTGRTKALDPEMTTAPHRNSGSLSWTLGVTSVDTRVTLEDTWVTPTDLPQLNLIPHSRCRDFLEGLSSEQI